jgi:hypothetical protein
MRHQIRGGRALPTGEPVSDDSTGRAELAVHPFEMAPEGGLCLGDASGALTSSPSGAYAHEAYLGTATGAIGRCHGTRTYLGAVRAPSPSSVVMPGQR